MLRTAGKQASKATIGQLLGLPPRPPIPPPRSLSPLRQPIAGPSSRPYSRPAVDNQDEVFDQPSLEYANYSRNPDEPAEPSSRRSGRAPQFTPAQLTLYHALRQLTFGSRRKRNKDKQTIKPSQTYRWALWSVRQVASDSGRGDLAAVSVKGKEKQREVAPQALGTSTHELSAPSWGLLLRYAVQQGDNETFAAIVEDFLDWRKRLVLEKMTHDKDQELQSRSNYFDHNGTASEPSPRSDEVSSELRTLHQSGHGNEKVQTIAQVISLARTLASKLDSGHNLFSPAGVTVTKLLEDASYRPLEDGSSSPYHLTALLRSKVPIPAATPPVVSTEGAAAKPSGLSGRPKTVRWLSSLKKPSEKRQVEEFMDLLSESSTDQLTAETLALKMKEREASIRARAAEVPAEMPSGGKKSRAARSKVSRQQAPSAETSKPFAFDLFGSPTDPESLSAILLRKNHLRQWLFSDRRYQDQELSASLDADGLLLAPSAADGTPHTWLFLLYAKSLSEGGDTAKLREILELYLSAWRDQQGNVPSPEIFEEGSSRKQRTQARRDINYFPNPHTVFAISKPESEPRGCDLLNYLLRSRVGRCLDGKTSQEEFRQGWKDCLDLCSEGVGGSAVESAQDEETTATEGTPRRLPLITPDETTILLLLDLLRRDSDRLSKAFNLIEESERLWGPPVREQETVQAHPYLHLTIRTSRILLSWARQAHDAEAAGKAVDLARRWREEDQARSEIKSRSRPLDPTGEDLNTTVLHGGESDPLSHQGSVPSQETSAGSYRRKDTADSTTATATGEISSSPSAAKGTAKRSLRPRTEYSTLRRPGHAWSLWKRAIGRAKAKDLLKPPKERLRGQKKDGIDVDERQGEQSHEMQQKTQP